MEGAGDAMSKPELDRSAVILYVDDDEANRYLMTRLFARKRSADRLLLASTGEEALQTARVTDPDLVLLDLTLPDLSGEEVLIILKQERELPVVILSGHDDPETRRRLTEQGAEAYITKPFDANELFGVIDRLLDQS